MKMSENYRSFKIERNTLEKAHDKINEAISEAFYGLINDLDDKIGYLKRFHHEEINNEE